MIKYLRKWIGDRSGVAMVEFGLTVPVLLLVFYGCIELTRYILIVQKVEKLAHTVADVTAQSRVVTMQSLDQMMVATGEIMQPFATGANSRIIISSLYRGPGSTTQPIVSWAYEGGGSLSVTSELGAVGSTPTMPAPFTFNERENVIAAEVYYQFSPLLTADFFGTTTIYRSAFYRPRLGLLTTAPG